MASDKCSLCWANGRKVEECNHVFDQSMSVFEGLNKQRLENSDVCDVTIHIKDTKMKAHMCVLMCSSRYFRALFSQRILSDSDAREVTLDLDVKAVQVVMDFIYTGRIEFSFVDVDNILQASDYLLVEELFTYIRQFLDASLNVETCLKTMVLGKLYSFQRIYENACEIFRSRFEDFIRPRDMFNELKLSDIIVLLDDANLSITLKKKVAKQLMTKWIHKNSERHLNQEIIDVLSRRNLDYEDLKQKRKKYQLMSTQEKQNATNQKHFKRPKRKLNDSKADPLFQDVSTQIEETTDSTSFGIQKHSEIDLIIVNGHGSHHAYIISQDRWVLLPPLPDKRKYHRMVQLDHEIYLVGGSQTAYIPSESCLDLVQLTWRALPPTNHVFLQAEDAVVTPNGQVCLLGQTAIAERYDPVEKVWLPLEDYKVGTELSELRAAVSDQRFFICFTEDELFTRNTVVRFSEYNYTESHWRALPHPPIQPQAKPVNSNNNPATTHILKNYNMFVRDNMVYLCNVNQDETKRHVLAFDMSSEIWIHKIQSQIPLTPALPEPSMQSKTLCWDKASCVLECDRNVPDWSRFVLSQSCSISGDPLVWTPCSPPPFTFLQDRIVVCHARLTPQQARTVLSLPTATYAHFQLKY